MAVIGKLRRKLELHGVYGLPIWLIKSVTFRVRNRIRIMKKWRVTRGEYEMFSWMADVSGLIHVGANDGGERFNYAEFDLKVLWVEPIKPVFENLSENIKDFPKQVAVNALITDRDGDQVDFYVANNSGASSSIFEIAEHADIWPEVFFEDSVRMVSLTLDTVMSGLANPVTAYQALVIDVQGAELKVLQGAENTLSNIKYIVAEAADFNAYEGGCTLAQLVEFLSPRGFEAKQREVSARHPVKGTYWDVLFVRRRTLGDHLKYLPLAISRKLSTKKLQW